MLTRERQSDFKQRESESDAVCSKMWLRAVPILMYTSEACPVLDHQFPYAPKATSHQQLMVMNAHKTSVKLRSVYRVETESEKD
jgi:hypothetical protein